MGSRPTLFSLGHPAYHQQGPQAPVIGSSSLDQSFFPMMCSPSALAQRSVLGRTKKMPRCDWMATPREVYNYEPCTVSRSVIECVFVPRSPRCLCKWALEQRKKLAVRDYK
ncbi:hypothetical protein V8C44DRAFT_344595 [Trichoderma aethiopicum]